MSTSVRATSAANWSAIGPSLTDTFAFQFESSTVSVSCVRACTERREGRPSGGSTPSDERRRPRTSSRSASRHSRGRLQDPSRTDSGTRSRTSTSSPRARPAESRGRPRQSCRRRIDGFQKLRRRARPSVPPRDELREDGSRDLRLWERSQVETGRAANSSECFLVEALLAQPVEHDTCAPRWRRGRCSRPARRGRLRAPPRRRGPSSRARPRPRRPRDRP